MKAEVPGVHEGHNVTLHRGSESEVGSLEEKSFLRQLTLRVCHLE